MKNLFGNACGHVLALTSLACFPVMAQTYNFTTIAGNAGYGTVDGIGSAARFNSPTGVALDPSGNLYVTDGMNNTIRKLTFSGGNWVVTTVAGTALTSGSANGTNGTALFNTPAGIHVAASGNIFVTDAGNCAIRKLAPSGGNWIVTTIAGLANNCDAIDGTNSVARFNNPLGVTTDVSGDLIVADTSNFTIRKITASGVNWVTTTIAGTAGNYDYADGTNGAVAFQGAIGVVRDGAGNIYVADSGNHTIRKLTPSGTNWVSITIAGLGNQSGAVDGSNSVARFYGPSGLARDVAGNLYVTDQANSTIRKMTLSGTNWVVTTIAGSPGSLASVDGTNASARFYYPYGITVDASSNLFVADYYNNTIRKISPSGTNWITTTIAGMAGGQGKLDGTNFVARFGEPHAGAIDTNGTVYFSDASNYAVRKMKKVGTNWVVTTIAGFLGSPGGGDGLNNDSRFLYPTALALESQTNLYVTDKFNHAIRQIKPEGTNWNTITIAGQIGMLGGHVDGTNTDAKFVAPDGIAVDTNGNLFVADSSDHTIRYLTHSGTNWITTTIAGLSNTQGSADGTNAVARFRFPTGLAVDALGNLIVADQSNYTIRKIARNGTNWVTTTLAGTAMSYGSVDGTNQFARFALPCSVSFTPDGSIIVAELGNTVRKMTPSGTNWIVTTIGGKLDVYDAVDGPGNIARFPGVQGATVDSTGKIFVFCNPSIVLGEPIAVVAAGPLLQIKKVGTNVVLYWPQTASDYNLETTSPLKPGATWTNRPGATVSGTNYWYTNKINGGAEFFRLRKP